MKIYNMAAKNLRGNLYRYIMYYLSNVFTISVFYIFANFIFHPNLNNGPLAPAAVAHIGVINGIIACLVIIVVFSILFVSYANSIFIKSRGKEFGLLSLFGMTGGQIKKYVLIEGTIIAVLSIVTGLFTGVLFSKLFFMAMEAFMDISLPFNISLKALGLTVAVFIVLFGLVNIFAISRIKNNEIIEQMKASRIPKEIPKFSKVKSILGIVLLAIGYIAAWLVDGAFVVIGMLPIIFIVIVGTYFVFTQFSIAIANKITKNKSMFYDKTNMVAFSQMIFKLQDTAKVLFLAAILGAITFSATETIYSFFTDALSVAGIDAAQDMVLIQKGVTLDDEESIDNIKEKLQDNGFEIDEYFKVKSIQVINETVEDRDGNSTEILVMSNSDYNILASSIDKEEISVKENEVVYHFPYETIGMDGKPEQIVRFPYESVKLNLNGEVREYNVSGETHGEVITLTKVGYYDALVLNDKDYESLLAKAKERDIVLFNGMNIDKWKKSYDASLEIEDMLGEKYQGSYYSKAIPYKQLRNHWGLALFIGFFIALLFFIASGSIIYFKLFNEIKQDGVEYNILKKIGITKKEMNKMITKQIAVIFFLPFVVSTLHSLFALKSLSNLLDAELLANGLIVMMGYFIVQGIYFLIIRRIYINRIEYLTV